MLTYCICLVTHLYRQQRSCEGYAFTGVCLSTQAGCLPQCMLGYHTPRADTSGADTPWEQTPPRADPPGRGHLPPRETATAADGTHPTGMHSCL